MELKSTIMIETSRLMLDRKTAFFANLLYQLPVLISKEVPTAATDGLSIVINPDFAAALTPKELRFLIIHEAMHVALDHNSRCKGREPKRWNVAGDYEINRSAVEAGMTMPKCGLLPPVSMNGMNAEQMYELIDPDSVGAGDTGLGDMQDIVGRPLTADEKAKLQTAILVAASASAGSLPGCIEAMVKAIKQPPLPWAELLEADLISTVSDYSFRRVNIPAMQQSSMIEPKLVNQTYSVGHIVVAIDTSGSITAADIGAFMGQINCIMTAVNPETVTLLQCDYKVGASATFDQGDALPESITVVGRGGTSFVPVFQWVEDNSIDPTAVIYFTDGDGAMPSEHPDYPVFWVSTETTNYPFGTVLPYKTR